MGYYICLAIGLIVGGHYWLDMRKSQPKPQPYILHLIDVVVVLAIGFGWILGAMLLLGIFLPR